MSDPLDARNFKFLIRGVNSFRQTEPFSDAFPSFIRESILLPKVLGFDINGLDRVGVPGY